jgi:hypothetical protein
MQRLIALLEDLERAATVNRNEHAPGSDNYSYYDGKATGVRISLEALRKSLHLSE